MAYIKAQQYIEDLHHGVHDFSGDTFKVFFTSNANAPVAATDAVLGDLTAVSVTNLDTVTLVLSSSSQTSGTYSCIFDDLVMTASGAVGPLQFVGMYNDSTAGATNPLLGWWDYGSEITMASSDTFTVNFTGAVITSS